VPARNIERDEPSNGTPVKPICVLTARRRPPPRATGIQSCRRRTRPAPQPFHPVELDAQHGERHADRELVEEVRQRLEVGPGEQVVRADLVERPDLVAEARHPQQAERDELPPHAAADLPHQQGPHRQERVERDLDAQRPRLAYPSE